MTSAPTDPSKEKLLTKKRLRVAPVLAWLAEAGVRGVVVPESERICALAGYIAVLEQEYAAQAALLDQAETELRAEMRRAYIVGEGCADGAELSEVAAAADLYVRNRLSDLRPPSPDEEGK